MPTSRNEYYYETMKDWLDVIEPQIEVVETFRELQDKLKQGGQLHSPLVYIQVMEENLEPITGGGGKIHQEEGRCGVNIMYGIKVSKDNDSYGKLRKEVHQAIDLIEAALRNKARPDVYPHKHRDKIVYTTTIDDVEINGNAKDIDDEQYTGIDLVMTTILFNNIYKQQ